VALPDKVWIQGEPNFVLSPLQKQRERAWQAVKTEKFDFTVQSQNEVISKASMSLFNLGESRLLTQNLVF
jgi:hypothetical protein